MMQRFFVIDAMDLLFQKKDVTVAGFGYAKLTFFSDNAIIKVSFSLL